MVQPFYFYRHYNSYNYNEVWFWKTADLIEVFSFSFFRQEVTSLYLLLFYKAIINFINSNDNYGNNNVILMILVLIVFCYWINPNSVRSSVSVLPMWVEQKRDTYTLNILTYELVSFDPE